MSIHLMAKAWRMDLPQGQKFLLVALCDHANDDGVCWPGQDSLSKKCSMNEKTVGRHIEWLESRGYLKSQRRQEGRKRLSDCYFIDLDAPQEPDILEPSKLEPDNLEGSKLSPKNPTICPHEPDNLSPSFNVEPSVEPSVNRQSKTREMRAPSAKKISFDAESISWSGIENRQVSAWQAAYPAVDLQTELAKAAAWLNAHPANKKSNYAAFLTRWFSRAQDSARPITSQQAAVGRRQGRSAQFDPAEYMNNRHKNTGGSGDERTIDGEFERVV